MTKFRFFLENLNFEISFLDNLAISGPGKCEIWNLGIKINKTAKYSLWEMMGSWVLTVLTDRAVIWICQKNFSKMPEKYIFF